MIVTAAIKINGRTFALPRPKRHHDIINYLVEVERLPIPIRGEQGFIDDQAGFVTREEAAHIALEQGQVKSLHAPPSLFSEDLW